MTFTSLLGMYYMMCFRFSLQLLASESIFCLNFKRRNFFILRLVLSIAGYFCISFLLLFLLFLIPQRNVFSNMLFYLLCFAVTLAVQYICFDVKTKDVLFAGSAGYAVQHIGYAGRTLVSYFTGRLTNELLDALCFSILPFIIVIIMAYFILVRPSQQKGEIKDKDWRMVLLSFVILLSTIFMNSLSDFGNGLQMNRFTISVVCKGYAVICCVMLLLTQFGFFRQNRLKHENELMEQLFKIEKEQHEVSKETINIKCHDLKHQIAALKDMDNAQRKSSIAELEKSVLIYDSMVKTGNDALDVLLMEKSLICEKYKINFSYIIDGKKLSMFSTPDVYSLFGNALDNAIEQVIKEDEDKRLISLRVKAENEMLFIHMDNYCSDNVEFTDGLPLTSKPDKTIHGFGTKSIEYIVKKYKGDFNMKLKDKRFNTDILLPLQ